MVLMLLSCVSCGAIGTQNGDNKNHPTDDTNTSTEIAIDEIIVMDHSEYSLKIKTLGTDYSGNLTVGIQAENKSSSKSFTFGVENASINGITCDAILFTDVTSGNTANDTVSFSDKLLRKYNVGEYTDIEITFSVRDSNHYDEEPTEKTVHIYPKGEDKAVKYTRVPQSTDTMIVDNEHVTAYIINRTQSENDYFVYELDLFLVNKTEKAICFESEDAAINGFMSDAKILSLLTPGACTFETLYWTKEDLEKNSITKIEEIEFLLCAYDLGEWGGSPDGYAYETVKLKA
ncbi:MAG: hypothetical protein E7616_05100 [Ruminococcaceae bacterium]|nr:hypothetical protein [Oscillospiraceae bacterium]